MKKINKITNIAFIFMLIGVILWQDIVHASDISNLRVPVGVKYERVQALAKEFQARGGRYELYGDPEGMPLVFISGLTGVTEIYSSQIDSFKEEGFYVVVYHLPLAKEAKAKGKKYSIGYIMQDLCEVMEELDIKKSHIIGESFGSFVAQYFTYWYPEKVGKLVLVSPAVYLQLPRRVEWLAKLLPIIPLSLSSRKFARDLISKKDGKDYKDKRKWFVERSMQHMDKETAVARSKLARKLDFRNMLHRITHDVVIVYGEKDGFMGKRDALRLEKELTNANVEVVPMDSGHIPSLIKPDIFTNTIRRFL